MASRVPLLLKNKGRKPTRLPIAPRAKPSNDRTKRVSLDAPVPVTPDNDDDDEPAQLLESLEPELETPAARPTPSATPTVIRAGGIAPGGSLAPRPSSAGVRSPILPVQRASEQRTQHVERLAKITAAGPVYRSAGNGLAPPRQASPVLGPRAAAAALPPAIVTQENPLTKRLVRKLDIKPHQSPRRAALAAPVPSIPSLAAAGISTAAPPAVVAKDDDDAPARGRKKPAPRNKATKRRVSDASESAAPPAKAARRSSLRRSAKKESSYRDAGDSPEDQDDDNDEDVDPNELDDARDEPPPVYVPARERATMWAKSVLKQQEEADEEEEGSGGSGSGSSGSSRALVVKATPPSAVPRRKRSNSSASSSLVAAARKSAARAKVEELLKKEPSQMTMGELALTVPKGRRVNRHEHEVAADSASLGSSLGAGLGSSLINAGALHRLRSFSVSSESAALGGSIVTPQVQIIDGKMVILESTVSISDVGTHRSDELSDADDGAPRRSGARYHLQPQVQGRRWGKDETKQFYYCLSQVGPNFSMMATLFPNRKRKELKCKFKYEEKHHPALIEIALKASAAPLDSEMVSVIAQMVDKDAKKKQAKLQRKQQQLGSVTGSDSPASAALEPTETPPPPHADFLDDYDDYYRERANSFDFAG
ncbi:hypothetical protein PybrP1_009246 [[Pythium] brassicae (nom. inval.)]|nr:hypothetical protein PybrP1_009246 [[Pythium] brassicae (nom. inval.)]